MRKRDYLFLGLLGLLTNLIVALFTPVPGYMDADYYLATGYQLAWGKGLTEPFLWNYLDNPTGLPHPSHSYWMPLASMIVAVLPGLTRISSFWMSRIPFIIIAAFIPAITAGLAFALSSSRKAAVCSGLLAAFAGFYLPFLPTTDTFGIYMLLGGGFFLILLNQRGVLKPKFLDSFLPGVLAGLMHLSRADGIYWVLIACLAWFLLSPSPKTRHSYIKLLGRCAITLTGYLVIMGPWFYRNVITFGSLFAPGGLKMLWLTTYDQIFSYPITGLTLDTWVKSGIGAISRIRLWSLGLNLANTFAVQGSIFLFPFVIAGLITYRKERVIIIAIIAWILLLTIMTLVFPFAGARGGFFHSGAAFQPFWWAITPIGLKETIQWISKLRGWQTIKAQRVFLAGMVGMTLILSIGVLVSRLPGWGVEAANYRNISNFMENEGLQTEDVVIVANPPGFYLISANPAIAIPDGTAETIIVLAEKYRAKYLILESGSIPAGLLSLYESPEVYPKIFYMGNIEEAQIYAIQP